MVYNAHHSENGDQILNATHTLWVSYHEGFFDNTYLSKGSGY